MPSITYWNRLEPRPRATDLAEALAARVRDPAWFLTRQWQLGEFQGEDAGSPAYVRIAAVLGKVRGWGPPDGVARRVAAEAPLERYAVSEPTSSDDLSLAVELGQTFDRFLDELAASDLRPHFLAAYPIPDAADDDPRTARLRSLWRGRAIDGISLWKACHAPQPPPPPDTTTGPATPPRGVPWSVPTARRAVARQAVRRLARWVETTTGALATDDPPGWRPAELDHRVRAYAGNPAGGTAVLDAVPDHDGELEWHAFEQSTEPARAGAIGPRISVVRRAAIPGPVRFRGMPNRRFWDFEDGHFDIGAIRPDRRNLASMILMDFMLVHGNDWYLVPFEQPVGTLCTSRLEVVDVFGGSTVVRRADTASSYPGAGGRFTMFSLARTDGGLADCFFVPSTAAGAAIDGDVLEQVRFLHDESANMAWAVEHTVAGPLGRGRPSADRAPGAESAEPRSTNEATIRYRLQSTVPAHWFPFQPVKLPGGHEVALERAALLSVSDDDTPAMPVPRGKVLAPAGLDGAARYRVREEQVPREGTRVTRKFRRSRGANGATYLWVTRTRDVGTGEGWSGLRFDRVVAIEPTSDVDEDS